MSVKGDDIEAADQVDARNIAPQHDSPLDLRVLSIKSINSLPKSTKPWPLSLPDYVYSNKTVSTRPNVFVIGGGVRMDHPVSRQNKGIHI